MRRWRSASTGRCFNAASRRVLKGSNGNARAFRTTMALLVCIHREKHMTKKILIGLSVMALAFAGAAIAQQAAVKRTPLQKAEFPDGYNTISGIAEIPAGGSAGRHTHPGVEMGYLLEGEADLIVEGRPDQHLKAGDSYMIPAGTP